MASASAALVGLPSILLPTTIALGSHFQLDLILFKLSSQLVRTEWIVLVINKVDAQNPNAPAFLRIVTTTSDDFTPYARCFQINNKWN